MGKYSSIGFINKSGEKKSDRRRRRTVLRDDNGKVAGYQIDHWSGRVDGIATPDTASPKPKVE